MSRSDGGGHNDARRIKHKLLSSAIKDVSSIERDTLSLRSKFKEILILKNRPCLPN